MRIAIMGSGGVGDTTAAARRRSQEVIFIARGAHLQALRDKGLHIKSVHGDFTVSLQRRRIVLVKSERLNSSLSLRRLTTPTRPLRPSSLDRGRHGGDFVAERNRCRRAHRVRGGMEHMVGGATWLSAALETPGRIGQYSQFRRIALGELDGRITPRAQGRLQSWQPSLPSLSWFPTSSSCSGRNSCLSQPSVRSAA